MDVRELKKAILSKSLGDGLLIFVCPDNRFLAESYIDAICAFKHLAKRYVMSLAETTDSALSLILDYSADMNVLKTDVFSEAAEDYSKFRNCVVLCKKADKSIADKIKGFVVEMPKLQDWQNKDYIKTSCLGLSDADVDWLYEACGHDIYKIDGALSKLKLLPVESRSKELRATCPDLFVLKHVFDLVDALVKCDVKTALDFVRHADDYSNLDPIGLTTLTLSKFKNILLVCYNSGVDPEALGMSKGALWHLRNENRGIPLPRVMKAIGFLSNIDSRLRENPSALDFSDCRKTAMLEYVVMGTLACGL